MTPGLLQEERNVESNQVDWQIEQSLYSEPDNTFSNDSICGFSREHLLEFRVETTYPDELYPTLSEESQVVCSNLTSQEKFNLPGNSLNSVRVDNQNFSWEDSCKRKHQENQEILGRNDTEGSCAFDGGTHSDSGSQIAFCNNPNDGTQNSTVETTRMITSSELCHGSSENSSQMMNNDVISGDSCSCPEVTSYHNLVEGQNFSSEDTHVQNCQDYMGIHGCEGEEGNCAFGAEIGSLIRESILIIGNIGSSDTDTLPLVEAVSPNLTEEEVVPQCLPLNSSIQLSHNADATFSESHQDTDLLFSSPFSNSSLDNSSKEDGRYSPDNVRQQDINNNRKRTRLAKFVPHTSPKSKSALSPYFLRKRSFSWRGKKGHLHKKIASQPSGKVRRQRVSQEMLALRHSIGCQKNVQSSTDPTSRISFGPKETHESSNDVMECYGSKMKNSVPDDHTLPRIFSALNSFISSTQSDSKHAESLCKLQSQSAQEAWSLLLQQAKQKSKRQD